ncbi:Zinc finger, CCHC-type [Corchorus capsularis]|uniref:Zinc finger, CCHC-type n=1 Tax=Corchorus capsularis TaxID=210143 RepID=A0A1R3G990_COCAP|nr:Zinc finger, CCHC-type [Corchorus capsularis]
MNTLYSVEQRRQNRQKVKVEGAMFAKKEKPKTKKVQFEKKNKGKKVADGEATKKEKPSPCPHCKKTSHTPKYCYFRPDRTCRACKEKGHIEKVCKNKNKALVQGSSAQAQVDEEKEEEIEEQLFVAVCCVSKAENNNVWLIDSGCSNHMVADESLFGYLDKSYTTRIKIGDGTYLRAVGRSCIIYEPEGRELITLPMVNKTFYLKLDEDVAYNSQNEETELWHKRLGHVNYKSLQEMKKKNLVENLPMISQCSSICEVCEYGKQSRLPFPKHSWRATKKLQLVHSDVCGPFRTASLNGKSGIQHQLTVAYTPQQNGVSERKNRTVLEMARCLLFEKGLPKKLWAKAVNTAVYILNRLTAKAMQQTTPFEAWYGFRPSVKHLKVFGCICYSHVPSVRRDKLDKRSEMGVLVGYSESAKGYRIYNPVTNKVIVSRDVKFDELAAWKWPENEEIQSLNDKEIGFDQINDEEELDVDHTPIRGTRLLSEIYEKCSLAIAEPAHDEEALSHPGWRAAMVEEMKMIEKNGTWELMDRPDDQKPIGVRWVYRTELNSDGSVNKLKARLVVKGYAQKEGVDFSETFASVARHDTIRLLLALAAQNSWRIYQLDVKSAFLNGMLKERIFVEQPVGFEVKDKKDKVYLLKKALYGLKQAPRAWYERLHQHFEVCGLQRSVSEPTLYVKMKNGDVLIVSVYVDDILVTGDSEEMIKGFKANMLKVFEMTDLEWNTANQPLGLKLSKEDGANKVDEKIFRKLVGSLLYLAATQPDIMFAVSMLSRFMHYPSELHYVAAKRILRYLKGTFDYGVLFKSVENVELHCYIDSDWGGSVDDAKSTSGYVFSLGSGVFNWLSKKQEVVAQSTAEAEYVAASCAVNQAIWIMKILTDLHQTSSKPVKIFCDNQSAIAIAKNPVQHGRTKHFKIKFHFIREAQENGEVELIHCRTEEQIADILTKPLPNNRFEDLREKLGVCSFATKGEIDGVGYKTR